MAGTDNLSEILPNLTVDADSLRDAVTYLKRFVVKKRPLDVLWGFDGQNLTLQMGASQATAEATGVWNGLAHTSFKFALAATSVLPEDETVLMRVEASRLYLHTSSVSCLWKEKTAPLAYAPQAIDLEGSLALRLRYTQQELEHDNLINRVEDAERKRNTMVTRAAKALEPLGITRKDLLDFIEGRLRRKYPQKSK